LLIYSAQASDDSSDGMAMIVVSDGIKFLDFDFRDCSIVSDGADDEEAELTDSDACGENSDGTTLSVDTANPITISNLVSVVVNNEGTYAYALADDTISVIDLSSESVTSTIALSAVIGHDIEFSASAILYTSIGENSYLVVSSDSLQSAIVVDLSQSYE